MFMYCMRFSWRHGAKYHQWWYAVLLWNAVAWLRSVSFQRQGNMKPAVRLDLPPAEQYC
jgi:hypothetical protein